MQRKYLRNAQAEFKMSAESVYVSWNFVLKYGVREPLYWTRCRIHPPAAQLHGNLILIHNLAGCLADSERSRCVRVLGNVIFIWIYTVGIQMTITCPFLFFSVFMCLHGGKQAESFASTEGVAKGWPSPKPPSHSFQAHPGVSLLYLLLREISSMQLPMYVPRSLPGSSTNV